MIPRGVNGDGAWDFAQGKPAPRPPQLSAETRDLEGDFDGPLVDWRGKGHVVTFEGKEAMPGGEALKLKVVMKSGLERMVYLDAKTYLDRRHTGLLNLPGNRQFDVVVHFDAWREVEGVKFPFDITEERTGKEPVVTLVTYTEKIELNQPMDDALFSPPPPAGQVAALSRAGAAPARAWARSMASAERSMSASVVRQFEIEIRIAGSAAHIVPPHQQTPDA